MSDDHQPGNEHWRIGVTNHFAHALGIAPSKDTWWSTTTQPGNPYSEHNSVCLGGVIGGSLMYLKMRFLLNINVSS